MHRIPNRIEIRAIEDLLELHKLQSELVTKRDELEKTSEAWVGTASSIQQRQRVERRDQLLAITIALELISSQFKVLHARDREKRHSDKQARKARNEELRIKQEEANKVKLARQQMELERTRLSLHARALRVLENHYHTVGLKIAMKSMIGQDIRQVIYNYADAYAKDQLRKDIHDMQLDKPITLPDLKLKETTDVDPS